MKYEQPDMVVVEIKEENIVITSLTGNTGGWNDEYNSPW